MLVLTRKIGESILIGDDIVITQLGVKGSQVRYGISAPDDVKIMRDELVAKDRELSPKSVDKPVRKQPTIQYRGR